MRLPTIIAATALALATFPAAHALSYGSHSYSHSYDSRPFDTITATKPASPIPVSAGTRAGITGFRTTTGMGFRSPRLASFKPPRPTVALQSTPQSRRDAQAKPLRR